MRPDGVSFDGIRSRADSQFRLEMLEHIARGVASGRVLNPHRLWLLTPDDYFVSNGKRIPSWQNKRWAKW